MPINLAYKRSFTNLLGYCVWSVNITSMYLSSWTESWNVGILCTFFPRIRWLLKYKELILLLSGCFSCQNLLLLLDPRSLPMFAKCAHQWHQYFSQDSGKRFSYLPNLQLWARELLFFTRETIKASPRLIKIWIFEMKEFLPGT